MIFNYKLTLTFPLFLFLFCNQNTESSSNDYSKDKNEKLQAKYTIPFNLGKPDRKIKLPKKLLEISGLSYYEEGSLLCLQDESADIYIIDYLSGKVKTKHKSSEKGDFEGIEYVNNQLYIIKSNGQLGEYPYFSNKNQEIIYLKTPLSAKNDVEGLGYDPSKNSLLIACKNRPYLKESKKKYENSRCIYRFDLKQRQLLKKPFIRIKLKELKKRYNIKQFMPSAIAFNPKDQTFYILSAVGSAIIVVNKNGNIVAAKNLDRKLFKQPEGVCFSPDGKTLFISNEGKNNKANILLFNYKP